MKQQIQFRQKTKNQFTWLIEAFRKSAVFDHPKNYDIKTYKNVQKLEMSNGDDNTVERLLDHQKKKKNTPY